MSTLDRKYNSNDNWGKLLNATADNFRMQNMENTMVSLSTLPRAPPAALYNPLEHGKSFRRQRSSEDPQVTGNKLKGFKLIQTDKMADGMMIVSWSKCIILRGRGISMTE